MCWIRKGGNLSGIGMVLRVDFISVNTPQLAAGLGFFCSHLLNLEQGRGHALLFAGECAGQH